MSQMQPVRGTHDLIGIEMKKHRFVVQTAQNLSAHYGFDEIKTPIFEFSNVFSRTLGDASDIVSKEMYTFTDKGGDQISLRPEGTASIVRALISEGLSQQLPLKCFYEGPMFRYERPQKGRYRQFYQLGVELLGVDKIDADLEVISLADNLLKKLNISDKTTLEINSIGDKESRDRYRTELVSYYKKYLADLSEDSKKRLEVNPLRILDSKDKNDIKINMSAPKLKDSFNEISLKTFDEIQNQLSILSIEYKINPFLVRGLDYYCHLVFEFKTTALGSQDAVLSGGRYDGLCELMGGPKTPGVGWAAGIERMCQLLPVLPVDSRPVTFIPLGEAAENECRKLAHTLRAQGLAIDIAYGGNLSNRMKKAVKNNAIATLIVGESELSSKEYTLKLLDTGTQEKVLVQDLKTRLISLLSP
jgi:histidyl-tRNA synthetase